MDHRHCHAHCVHRGQCGLLSCTCRQHVHISIPTIKHTRLRDRKMSWLLCMWKGQWNGYNVEPLEVQPAPAAEHPRKSDYQRAANYQQSHNCPRWHEGALSCAAGTLGAAAAVAMACLLMRADFLRGAVASETAEAAGLAAAHGTAAPARAAAAVAACWVSLPVVSLLVVA